MGSNKKLTAMLLVCLALLFVIVYSLTVYPRIIDMKDRADAASAEAKIAKDKLEEARNLDEDDIDQRLGNLRSRIPSSLELPNLIVRLDALARDTELTWITGNPEDITVRAQQQETQTQSPEGESELLEKFDLSITVQGDINNLIKFMQGMTDRSIGRVVVIQSVDLQYNAEDNPDFVEASLKLEVIGWVDGASIDTSGCIEDEVGGVICDFSNNEEN